MARDAPTVYSEWLVLAAQRGDAAALGRLVDELGPAFARYARVMAARGADRDAAQEAWLAICRGIRGLRDPDRFGAWAFGILARKCADTLRRRAAGAAAPLAVEPAAPPAPAAESASAAVTRAVERLEPALREVVALFYGAGLDIRTIAEVTAAPIGTVKSRLFSARQKLAQTLEPEAPGRD